MPQTEFTGMLIVALGGILGIVSIVGAMISSYIIKPFKQSNKEMQCSLERLNETLIKLNAITDNVLSDVSRLDRRVGRHGERLDEHDIILARNNLK